MADNRRLYQMRYVDLAQGYFIAYANGLANAVYWENGTSGAVLSHLESIDSMEQPAVIADFLLRFDKVQWALVTAVQDGRIKKGDLVLLEAMGGGFTWGAALLRW